jgi:uncharacterized protein with NRDE domain
MCLIAFAWRAHPRYPLVLVANRDEFHERPTSALHEWTDAPGVFGGRDLREGGGWLALAQSGRMAAVTNFREPKLMPAPRSRGALVRQFMLEPADPADFAEEVRTQASEYGPFNLLLRKDQDLIHVSNRPTPAWDRVAAGVHGLSNGRLDAPWPKTRHLATALRNWLNSASADRADTGALFEALADDRLAADAELPDTGVGLEIERRLSPAFIRGVEYGTRASSVLLIGEEGLARFIERSFGSGGVPAGERAFDIQLLPD